MAIIVKPIDELFKIVIDCEEEKIEFLIKQLDYKTKSFITGLTTYIKEGQVMVDSTLTCFYNLKHGLKEVHGILDEDENPYKLEFENKEKTCLTDKCTDELLATPFSDRLQFCARELSNACYPTQVLHPITGTPLAGIEIVPAKELKGARKK